MEARKEMGRGGKEDSRRQRLSRSRELGWFPAEDRRGDDFSDEKFEEDLEVDEPS